MKIQVLAMGRPREPFIIQGVEHYQTRLKPLLPVEWTFLPEPGRGRSLSEEQRRELEGQEFLRRIDGRDALFLLDERGRQWTSEELSSRLYEKIALGQGKLIFLIGGPYGTSKELQARADMLLSLSKMTFTHEMALLLMAEQIYRAAMIHSGSKYHH
ncbi:MAG: 23S rRNA (pseudouridine(1915)-N(3))-methyltransferase RlmH [Pyramidobacter sp.]|nr:23S rRNA (pseudouridine(1915)-N(3))-methyltransferase RlmH [Pyramidobacter sp.]MBQ4490139.1 23S rRNA (pseudouridine(1915)-N(3))-methyltransferase RlmH [Pyramidobacter sp.]MBR0108249.1 23S rRNA (pseudouridine(1915)-N(3))-methyltransferase RlmH [Pyramidobacter sp.]